MSGAVSGAFARFRGLTSPFSKHLSGGLLNASGRAGPRRLAVLIAGLLAVIALVVVIATSRREAQVDVARRADAARRSVARRTAQHARAGRDRSAGQ